LQLFFNHSFSKRPARIRKKQKHQADDRANPQRVQILEETPQEVTTKIKNVVTPGASVFARASIVVSTQEEAEKLMTSGHEFH